MLDAAESTLALEAHSSLGGLGAGAHGIEGELDVPLRADGSIDDEQQPAGVMTFEVRHLQRANPLYAVEIERLLDARNHPTVVVELGRSEAVDPGQRYRVEGTLTVRGVTRPLEGELSIEFPDPNTLLLHGERVVDVRRYGIEPPHFLLWRVQPDVTVRLAVRARRVTSSPGRSA